jgi:hypothetical protein
MSLVYGFKNEVEFILDDKIRGFTVDALDTVPDYYEMDDFILHTRKAVELSKVFYDTLSLDDYARDVVTSAILLQDITRFKLEEVDDEDATHKVVEDPIHPLTVRMKLLPLLGSVGADTFEDILRTIESSHGLNSPIPHVVPQLADPVYVWILPFVNGLASSIEG